MSDMPLRAKPDEGPWGQCDWGDCDSEAVQWRWSPGQGWLPVCGSHFRPQTDRDLLYRLAWKITSQHKERLTGIGKGHCIACREKWPCTPKQLAAIYLDVSGAS